MEKVRIGMFGARRGGSYLSILQADYMKDKIEVVAICEKDYETIGTEKNHPGAPCFKDFDEFLAYGKEHGMNAVFLANYFDEHAPYAIKCMEAGMNVISECTAASTLKECVELVECVERTGMKYMLAENYPFSASNLEMNNFVHSGKMGAIYYAEGEYNHCGTYESFESVCVSNPGKHWRGLLPSTYYLTHAMGPLMYMTESMPLYVSGRSTFSPVMYSEQADHRSNFDGCGMMFAEMSNGMTARFTGCTQMASDYSRYRIVGEKASIENSGITSGKVRKFYVNRFRPEGEPQDCTYVVSQSDFGPNGKLAATGGHGGGDTWVVCNMYEYFVNGKDPFFDVYRSVAMSATAILGWKSALNHGENFRIPDFKNPADREAARKDTDTPFPDANGEGATLPPCLPRN